MLIIIGLFLLVLFINRSPFGKSNSSFASVPKEEITKIEFSGEGKKLVLEKKGESWFVNGKSEARKSGVLFILRILKEIKIQSPVSPELFESEIELKKVAPVKVKIFEKGRLLKSFLVYKTRSNPYGNIMKMKEQSKPFIVCVPGYNSDIGSGFTLNELFWQPYTVFNLLPSEITSIKFDNFIEKASSFSITKRGNRFILDGDNIDGSGQDTSLIARYISYFAWIPFESWALNIDDAEKKSIEASQPLYMITVKTGTGSMRVLTLWGMMNNQSGSKTLDSDRLFGKTGEKDEFFIMRYFDIDPLIKKRSYFFPE